MIHFFKVPSDSFKFWKDNLSYPLAKAILLSRREVFDISECSTLVEESLTYLIIY